ncbi:MAG: heavy metal translocating P-type ATPase, partial [Marinilabiliales bacterium]
TLEQKQIIKSVTAHSSHPLSVAINNSIDINDLIEIDDFMEIPSMGISATINGKKVNIGSKKFVTGKDEQETKATNVFVFIDEKIIGHYTLENRYREGLEEVIKAFSKNKKLFLLSGDNDSERQNLQKYFGENATMLFNQSPTDKKDFIKKLKNDPNCHVLMIGDGLNDAGALMESEVGLTVADDIFSFSPACEGIIESSKFDKLYNFINFSKISMQVVRASFVISFLYNLIGLYFAVQGILSPIIAAILMPVSSISVVAFATFTIKLLSDKKLQ